MEFTKEEKEIMIIAIKNGADVVEEQILDSLVATGAEAYSDVTDAIIGNYADKIRIILEKLSNN